MKVLNLLESGDLRQFVREISDKYALRIRRSIGQHFMIDKGLIDLLILNSELKSDDIIIEIGTGIGILTYFLLKNCKKVYSYEIDPLLASLVRKEFIEFDKKLDIISEDFLKTELPFHHKIVSNLPYNISSPFFHRISVLKHSPELIVVTLQREFAKHLCAAPATSNYSKISVYPSYFFKFRTIIEDISPHSFYPSPKVYSSIIRGDCLSPPDVVKTADYINFLNHLFCRKHKKVKNNLKPYFKEKYSFKWKNYYSRLDELENMESQPINLDREEILLIYNDIRKNFPEN